MATKTLLSLADYAALPADGKRSELVEGELVELAFPSLVHARIRSFLNVEIVSPSNSREEIRRKVGQYLAAGADLTWVVDPKRRTIQTLGPSGKETLFTTADELTASALLPGFSVSVRDILDA